MSETAFRRRIELHGWDPEAFGWHGPDELAFRPAGCRGLIRKLLDLPGSWHGMLRAKVAGEPSLSFRASFHNLADAGLGTIDLDGSPGGPMQIILVVPFPGPTRLRPELAFEFASFVRFLEGPETTGTELVRVHLSQQAEKLTMAMVACMTRLERGALAAERERAA